LWRRHLNRKTLKDYFDLCKKDNPDVDALSQVAAALPGYSLGSLTMLANRMCPNGMEIVSEYMRAYPTYRFWGSLVPLQKQALRNGGRLTYGNLSPIQQRIFQDLVAKGRGGDGFLQVQLREGTPDSPFSNERGSVDINNSFGSLENGIPRNTSIFLEGRMSRSVKVISKASSSQMQSTDQFGSWFLSDDHRNSAIYAEPAGFQAVNVLDQCLVFRFSPSLSGYTFIMGSCQPASKVVGNWRNLPKEFVGEIEEALAKSKERTKPQ
jgi:hypothetical protein